VTLVSILSSDKFYHVLIAVSSNFVELYLNGSYVALKTGDFSAFFQGAIVGSSIKIGGENIP
jgi:hypothetical protein